MKVVLSIFAGIVLVVLVFSAAYRVNEEEQVVIVQLGEPTELIQKPGLHFKVPIYQDAVRFEKRWLEWDGDANQITTLDKRYIYIDVFARWRIADPMLFIEVLRDERSAQGRLDDIIDNATRNVVANHNLIELIRTTSRVFAVTDEETQLTGGSSPADVPSPLPVPQPEPVPAAVEADAGVDDGGVAPAPVAAPEPTRVAHVDTPARSQSNRSQAIYAIEVGREKLTELILEKASVKAAELGIEVKDVQFKRINYIESVQTKVFDRMISERQRVAEAFRSQGRGRSAEILGQTEKELKKIRSEAYRTAQEVMGQADGEAAAIYARAYETDPELYNFLKTLESYRETVDSSSWLLLSTEADYARHLKTMKKGPR